MSLYLDLIKKVLTNWIYIQEEGVDPTLRRDGGDWSAVAHTMIGIKRLNNIQFCMEDIIKNNIPGDVIECGVWRGGATILMAAILKERHVNRTVWVADSFQGLPKPEHREDTGDDHWKHKILSVPLKKVRRNFQVYDLLDTNIMFLEGLFKDTLPTAPIEKLSLLRVDCDMYKSTMDVLVNLYPKLSPGGYCIIDDYGVLPACKKAVIDYRNAHGINDEIRVIDASGIYWKKEMAQNERDTDYVF